MSIHCELFGTFATFMVLFGIFWCSPKFGQCGRGEIEDGLTGGVPMPMPMPVPLPLQEQPFLSSQSTFGCGAACAAAIFNGGGFGRIVKKAKIVQK